MHFIYTYKEDTFWKYIGNTVPLPFPSDLLQKPHIPPKHIKQTMLVDMLITEFTFW